MTRQQIEAISIGQTGLYQWNPKAPVVALYPVQIALSGKAFRYVMVASATGNATIGFIVAEAR